MDITRAKEILATLAEGVDPTTGEVLPNNSVCNKGEIVRAFYAVLNHLDEKKPKKNMPTNAGKPWSVEAEKELCEMYNEGISAHELCEHFHRTRESIAARLVRLGKISERSELK
jgi:hypothetical protein